LAKKAAKAAAKAAAKQNKKPKKSSNKKKGISISSETDLVRIVSSILNNVPNAPGRLQISAVGDRIQDLTNQSWNKKFKPQFGVLKSFLAQRPEFTVKDETVYLKGEYERIAAAKADAALISPKKPKKNPANSDSADQQSRRQKAPRSSSPSSSRSRSNAGKDAAADSGARPLFIVLIVAVVAVAILVGLDANLF